MSNAPDEKNKMMRKLCTMLTFLTWSWRGKFNLKLVDVTETFRHRLTGGGVGGGSITQNKGSSPGL